MRNKEKASEYYKTYKEKNKEKIAARKKKWDEENKGYAEEYHLIRTYGITKEDYSYLLESQDFRCKCCGLHHSQAVRGKLFVDHCHNTGKIRGLLCSKCNTVLGLVEDSKETLSNMISYLLESEQAYEDLTSEEAV